MNFIQQLKFVKLKSVVGDFGFTHRVRFDLPGGAVRYHTERYDFNKDNGFVSQVFEGVWEEIKNQYADQEQGMRYSDILKPIK